MKELSELGIEASVYLLRLHSRIVAVAPGVLQRSRALLAAHAREFHEDSGRYRNLKTR